MLQGPLRARRAITIAAAGVTAADGGVIVLAAGLASAGAAAIHLAVARSHFEEYVLFGLFFVRGGVAQLTWAIAVAWHPSRGLLALAAAGNAAVVALLRVDRIWGLPIGPEHRTPERVGYADSAASALELLIVLGCCALLAGSRSLAAGARPRAPTRGCRAARGLHGDRVGAAVRGRRRRDPRPASA